MTWKNSRGTSEGSKEKSTLIMIKKFPKYKANNTSVIQKAPWPGNRVNAKSITNLRIITLPNQGEKKKV